jgi:hypothetical protein
VRQCDEDQGNRKTKRKEKIMEGISWPLVIAVFFYFMMRFGCAAHMVHGGHGGQGAHGAGDSEMDHSAHGGSAVATGR